MSSFLRTITSAAWLVSVTLTWGSELAAPSPSPKLYWSAPYDKIWMSHKQQCTGVDSLQHVTLEECQQKCGESLECNTVDHPLGACYLHACDTPVPEPQSVSQEGCVGYEYRGNASWSAMKPKIWSHEQCKGLGSGYKDKTLEECQTLCEAKNMYEGCNTVNFQVYGDCWMHACKTPVEDPTSSYKKNGRTFAGYKTVSHPTFSNASVTWNLAASNCGDISTQLTLGLSSETSKSVTRKQQLGLANAFAASAKFFGTGWSDSLTTSYLPSLAKEIETSETHLVENALNVTCGVQAELTGLYKTWNLWQWQLSGQEASNKITGLTAAVRCIPADFVGPQCPVNCCDDRVAWCQKCKPGCLKDREEVLV